MTVLPTIKTSRLILRNLRESDIPNIVEMANDPEIASTTLNIASPYTRKNAIQWLKVAELGLINKDHLIFAIALSPGDQLIGGIGLRINKRHHHAEVGFWIGKPYWKNGYASEALKEILKYGLQEMKLHKIFGHHMKNNPGSGKVMMKSGMHREAELKEHIFKDGTFHDLIQYAKF